MDQTTQAKCHSSRVKGMFIKGQMAKQMYGCQAKFVSKIPEYRRSPPTLSPLFRMRRLQSERQIHKTLRAVLLACGNYINKTDCFPRRLSSKIIRPALPIAQFRMHQCDVDNCSGICAFTVAHQLVLEKKLLKDPTSVVTSSTPDVTCFSTFIPLESENYSISDALGENGFRHAS